MNRTPKEITSEIKRMIDGAVAADRFELQSFLDAQAEGQPVGAALTSLLAVTVPQAGLREDIFVMVMAHPGCLSQIAAYARDRFRLVQQTVAAAAGMPCNQVWLAGAKASMAA